MHASLVLFYWLLAGRAVLRVTQNPSNIVSLAFISTSRIQQWHSYSLSYWSKTNKQNNKQTQLLQRPFLRSFARRWRMGVTATRKAEFLAAAAIHIRDAAWIARVCAVVTHNQTARCTRAVSQWRIILHQQADGVKQERPEWEMRSNIKRVSYCLLNSQYLSKTEGSR